MNNSPKQSEKSTATDWIQAVVAVLLLVLAIINFSQFRQQQKEEGLKFKAYVVVLNSITDRENNGSKWIKLTIGNLGLTPAENVTVEHFIGDNEYGPVEREDAIKLGFLGTNQPANLQFLVKQDIQEIKLGSKRFFHVLIGYYDYLGRKNCIMYKLQSGTENSIVRIYPTGSKNSSLCQDTQKDISFTNRLNTINGFTYLAK